MSVLICINIIVAMICYSMFIRSWYRNEPYLLKLIFCAVYSLISLLAILNYLDLFI